MAAARQPLPLPASTPESRDDWAPIIRAYDHRVVMSIVALGVRFERARELAQQTWTRLIEQHKNGALRDMTFPGVALAQARFLALDELRRNQAEQRALNKWSTSSKVLVETTTDPERALISRDQLEHAKKIVLEQSGSAQRILLAVYRDPDRTHAEIAAELGLSTQRVRQILCEMRRKLRDLLEDETW